jgi:hypothetical protein
MGIFLQPFLGKAVVGGLDAADGKHPVLFHAFHALLRGITIVEKYAAPGAEPKLNAMHRL